jgi:hypothetical protein
MHKKSSVELMANEICYASLGNINMNFEKISFELDGINGINVQFILKEKTNIEEELIDDILTEFLALHGKIDNFRWEVFLSSEDIVTLSFLTFKSYYCS